jgi:ribosomal protein S10
MTRRADHKRFLALKAAEQAHTEALMSAKTSTEVSEINQAFIAAVAALDALDG